MIAHAIEDAREAARVHRCIVSTDDAEIADVAREHGGDVPFTRPAELASDTASIADTITHALEWLADEAGEQYDVVCLVQPTSPLRAAADVDGALERLADSGAESVVSVSKYVTPPQWAVTADEDGFLSETFDTGALWSGSPERSQDLPEQLHPNGAVFAATIDAWHEYEGFYTDRTVGFEMPPSGLSTWTSRGNSNSCVPSCDGQRVTGRTTRPSR
ncbi:cytidylyltransferase domain-containing protein [Halobaculum litoreum]|uniref:Cytidylyltransferase domain-containing protein n=1 Tax=Halobaculum litoreum TaxID=3031998 RepID=A0ABD5XSJ0_9EURY